MLFTSRKQEQIAAFWLNGDGDTDWWPDLETWDKQKSATDYIQAWISACADRPTGITVSDQDGTWEQLQQRMADANRFSLRLHLSGAAAISGRLIDTLQIDGAGPVTLTGCAIRHLALGKDQPRSLRLKHCKIGTMRLSEKSLDAFEMEKCSLWRLFAPMPGEASPFTGSVEVRDLKLSPAFENAQMYRNLRHHLAGLHNHEAASVFHAAEMRAEVQKLSWIDRSISGIYNLLSDYGGSSARPFSIFCALTLLNFAMLFATDGVAFLEQPKPADGWHYALYGPGGTARLLRAAVFAFSQEVNPFGMFGTRLSLSGATPAVALTSALLGLVSTISFALFVLAVRRRFRL